MFKSLNPESLDLNDITTYVKCDRNSQYFTDAALERAIAAETSKRKQENFDYKTLLILNLFLILASVIGSIVTLINVFAGNWNYAAGFALMTYAAAWIFRRIPYPMSRFERNMAELRALVDR